MKGRAFPKRTCLREMVVLLNGRRANNSLEPLPRRRDDVVILIYTKYSSPYITVSREAMLSHTFVVEDFGFQLICSTTVDGGIRLDVVSETIELIKRVVRRCSCGSKWNTRLMTWRKKSVF